MDDHHHPRRCCQPLDVENNKVEEDVTLTKLEKQVIMSEFIRINL